MPTTTLTSAQREELRRRVSEARHRVLAVEAEPPLANVPSRNNGEPPEVEVETLLVGGGSKVGRPLSARVVKRDRLVKAPELVRLLERRAAHVVAAADRVTGIATQLDKSEDLTYDEALVLRGFLVVVNHAAARMIVDADRIASRLVDSGWSDDVDDLHRYEFRGLAC